MAGASGSFMRSRICHTTVTTPHLLSRICHCQSQSPEFAPACTRAFGALRRRRALRWAKDARAAGTEDKRNHYQVFFAEDSTEAPRRGRPFLNLSHCGRSHSETTRNDVYMHCEHFENKRKQKL